MSDRHRDQPPATSSNDGAMGFLDHLEELRKRLIRSCLAIVAGMLMSWWFVDRIAAFVLAPTVARLPSGASLVATKWGEPFAFHFDIALLTGVILAAPVVMYQVWRFVAPGLYAGEKRLVFPFVLMASAGTLAGAAFAHYLLFPSALSFFAAFDSPLVRLTPRIEDTFGLYKSMLLTMVAVFQMPTLILFLALLGVVTPRFLWHHIKYAILGSFIASAVMTASADPWNQALLAAPIIALYIVSIGVAWLASFSRRKRTASMSEAEKVCLVLMAAAARQITRGSRMAQPSFRASGAEG